MSDGDNPSAKFLRLHNGDDLIAEVVETEDDNGISYTVFHPLKVVYMPTEAGYLSVSFMPWIFPSISDQQEFVIHSEDIMLLTDVTEKMNKYYWESVTTYMSKDEKDKETPKSTDEEYELLKRAIEHLGLKRTFH
jgi:hypothetical protein